MADTNNSTSVRSDPLVPCFAFSLLPIGSRAMKITFNFQGGFLDGRAITGDTDLRVCDCSARRYVFLTDCGRVGKRFREFPPERSEQIRQLLETQTASMDAMDAVVHKVMGQIDPCNPPTCRQLKKMMGKALAEIGVDVSDYLRKSQEEIDRCNRELECIRSEVYEVAARKDCCDQIMVQVKFVGEDTAPSMYDL